jgi:SAM-dependent methyltransferase
MTSCHLDIGCGGVPRNPYGRDEAHGVDIALPEGADPRLFKRANLSLEPIPYPDATFDSVSAFDFLEHVPRVLMAPDGRNTRFPFIELMNEIHRVLKPGALFYALTPAYPSVEAFQDPTHVNVITEGTWQYFCGSPPQGRMYGFTGEFEMRRNERALYPEAFDPTASVGWSRRRRQRRLEQTGRLSHLMWEFACVKPAGTGGA